MIIICLFTSLTGALAFGHHLLCSTKLQNPRLQQSIHLMTFLLQNKALNIDMYLHRSSKIMVCMCSFIKI